MSANYNDAVSSDLVELVSGDATPKANKTGNSATQDAACISFLGNTTGKFNCR